MIITIKAGYFNMPVFWVFGLKELSLSQRLRKTLCTVWGDFNYARRKAPTSLCYKGDETLISSIWKKVPQMFCMRWLLAAAALFEHVHQLVSVCLSCCLLVSALCIIIWGASTSAMHSALLPLLSTSPSLFLHAIPPLQSQRRAYLCENDSKQWNI